MNGYDALRRAKGFHWDTDNTEKNLIKHQVAPTEAEQIFFNQPLIAFQDAKHSEHEERFYALGQTDEGRLLFVAFTLRNDLIRVISARDMSRQERRKYI